MGLNFFLDQFIDMPVIYGKEVTLFLYSKTCVKRPLSKRPKIGFRDQLHVSLNTGQNIAECSKGSILQYS